MGDTVCINIDGQSHEFPVVVGSEQERAFDIRRLRSDTGVTTLDNGFVSTASCSSGVTFLNGEQGVLRYRGYPIEQLADRSSFVEVSYLLIYGELPSAAQLAEFRGLIADASVLHEDVRRLIEAFPRGAHPMSALASVVCALGGVYESQADNEADERTMICQLMSSIRAVATAFYKQQTGEPLVSPLRSVGYCGNFLRQMFGRPDREFVVDPAVERALDLLLILHADHEQNCSTSTVRLVGSSQASLFSSIAAGINALSGPLHGGANQAVIEMLQRIHEDGGDTEKYVALAKDRESGFRLMGFGHRVYKNFDPRALIIKGHCQRVLDALGIDDPLLDIAASLEKAAREDEYFVKRNLYPNVDFYSGIIYRALGIPTDMFTVMFAIGRLPGWIAQWKEMNEDSAARIGRPRQVYVGANARDFVEMDDRS
jgi:citrate synthase